MITEGLKASHAEGGEIKLLTVITEPLTKSIVQVRNPLLTIACVLALQINVRQSGVSTVSLTYANRSIRRSLWDGPKTTGHMTMHPSSTTVLRPIMGHNGFVR